MTSHKILLADPEATYSDLVTWARGNCESFTRSNQTDVSDVSYTADMIYEFWFRDQKDATMFYMRWS